MSSFSGNLWLSSLAAANDETFINKHQIEFIIGILDPADKFVYKKQITDAVTVVKVSFKDGSDGYINVYLTQIHKVLSDALKANKAVLVHCYSGQSRSVSAVLLYAMVELRMSLSVSFSFSLM